MSLIPRMTKTIADTDGYMRSPDRFQSTAVITGSLNEWDAGVPHVRVNGVGVFTPTEAQIAPDFFFFGVKYRTWMLCVCLHR